MNKKTKNMFLVILMFLFVVFSISGCKIDFNKKHENNVQKHKDDKSNDNSKKNNDIEDKKNTVTKENKDIKSINGLIIGCDKSKNLTDVIMVAHYDPKENKVKLISIPRDLLINFEQDFKKVKQNNKNIRIRYCKMTEVYSNAGANKKAIESLKSIAGIITGMKINYYAKIDLEGFKKIVDMFGGIEFDVPQDMKYYDPSQGLYINLKKGHQFLDGKHAEMLVRFRGYNNADLGRIKMQQKLLIEFVKKITKIDSGDKVLKLVYNFYKYIETDFNVFDGIKYVKYIRKLDVSKLLEKENIVTIPAKSERVDKLWYLIWNKEETEKTLKMLFEGN